jgi:hypothetical protein
MNELIILILTNAVFVSIILGVVAFKIVVYWEKKSKKEMESKWPQVGKRMRIPKQIDEQLDEIEKRIS